MVIDRCAEFIVRTLNEKGYKAYIVGGCVRDSIMGRTPKDWDICTNAFPSTVHQIFETFGLNVIDTGLKFGTVSILMAPSDIGVITQSDEEFELKDMESNLYEVTTFRNHSGGRKPESVSFGDSIETDLLRRDFTMNAIAYNPDEGFIDIVNGLEDINNKIIRCVKEPQQRLSEDGLRILRAIRFESQLGFDIEENTKYWINKLIGQISDTSVERIQAELNKLLLGEYVIKSLENNKEVLGKLFPEIKKMIGFEQNNPNHLYDVYRHSVKTLEVLVSEGENDLILRMAAFFHDIGKPQTYSEDEKGIGHFYNHAEVSALMTKSILTRLNYDNNTINNVTALIHYHDRYFENKASIKRFMNKMSNEQIQRLFKLRHADILAQSSYKIEVKLKQLSNATKWHKQILDNNETFSLKDLDITGRDLIIAGYTPGKSFSIILEDLLNQVIEENVRNNKSDLINYIKKHYDVAYSV